MFLIHQWIKNEPVDLLIGNTYGKYIARDEDIPLVRLGFPISGPGRPQYFPTVGYRGGIRLLEKILDAFLDRQDREARKKVLNWSCKGRVCLLLVPRLCLGMHGREAEPGNQKKAQPSGAGFGISGKHG